MPPPRHPLLFVLAALGRMNGIVIPSLYLVAGVTAYAAINHLSIVLRRPRDRVHLLFTGMCLLATMFALSQARAYQAETVAVYARALTWNLALIVPFFLLFSWFIAEYTGVRARPLLTGLSVLFTVLFVVNLTQPYSLQFQSIQRLERLQLPWAEALARPVGELNLWFPVAMAGMLTAYGYAFYALGVLYRRRHGRAALVMMFELGTLVFALMALEGILVRLSVIDFVHLGPFGFLAVVVAMSMTLSYETQQRVIASENRFRSLVEQSPFSIQILSPDGRTLQVNPAWEKLWGLRAEDLASYNLLQDEQLIAKGVLPFLERSLAGEPAEIPPIVYNPADNPVVRGPVRDRWVRAFVYPLKDTAGAVRELILMHEDVTEKKRREDSIRLIAAGVSAEIAERFFHQLVRSLAKLFAADYAFIAVLDEQDAQKVSTLAVWPTARSLPT